MGNWKIEIDGHGIHHNGRTDDADAMAKAFVQALIGAGHEVKSAKLMLTNADGSPVPNSADTDLK